LLWHGFRPSGSPDFLTYNRTSPQLRASLFNSHAFGEWFHGCGEQLLEGLGGA